MEITPTSPTTAPSLYPDVIYKRLTLAAIHRIDPPVTILNLYLVPALYLVNTTYKDEVIINML